MPASLFRPQVQPLASDPLRACTVCGSGRVRRSWVGGYRHRERQYDILQCRDCGLFFVDPLPTDDVLMEVYRGDDYFETYRAPGSTAVGYLSTLADGPNRHDDETLSWIRDRTPSGRLLDIGCAGGRFLVRARTAGYDVAGIEPNPRMAAHARAELGLDVREGTVEDLAALFGPAAFDVIHLADVLEHLPDLHGSIAHIRQALKPGGLLVLQQPITYNRSIFNALLRVNMQLKQDPYSPYPPLHVWEFTPCSLRQLLDRSGFEIVRLRTFESDPLPDGTSSLKKRLAAATRRVSCTVSNWSVMSSLELGNRALVAAQRL